MSPLAFRSPKVAISAAGSAAVTAYCLRQLYVHSLNFMLGDRKALCGSNTGWEVSLGNDCFRLGFLWPALLLSFGGMVAISFCLCYVLPPGDANEFTSDGSSPFSWFSVGNKLAPAHCPPGQTITVDNRIRVGLCTVLLLTVQTVLFSMWANAESATKDGGINDSLYSTAMQQLSAVVLLFSVGCLVMLWRSNRMTYAGLFPWILPAAVGVQLFSGLCEVYASFFTDKNANVPVVGTNASMRSNILILTTIFNLVLLVLFSLVQWRPIFFRPLANTQSSSMDSSYTPILAAGDDVSDDNDATPLAHMNDQKTGVLVDTPEQNSSWFDKLTFSWPNELLKRGAASNVNYSDLYLLQRKNMPLTNWKRYQRFRKPGRSLLVALALTFAPELLVQFGLAMIRCVLEFAGPFFLQRILRSIEVSQNGSLANNIHKNYLDVLGLLFFTILSSILFNQSAWIGRQVSIRLKGLLVAELSTKTLRRRGKGSSEEETKTDKDNNESEDDVKEYSADTDGKVMNILTADFEMVTSIGSCLEDIYILPFTLAIGIWYMYRMLGISALIGLLVTILYGHLSKLMFSRYRIRREQQSAASDRRVATITELLQGIKAVKLFGWESRFLQKVDERREHQLDYSWKVFLWSTGISVIALLNPIIILAIMFTSYVVVFGNTLSAEIAFTSISIFQMVRIAISHFPRYVNTGVGGYVALKRMNSYLKQPQVQDLEERMPAQTISDELGFDCADLEWDSFETTKDTVDIDSIAIKNADSAVDSSQTTEITPLLAGISQTQTTLSVRPSATQITDQEDASRFSLKGVDVRFPLGGLSIVAGPTGSGKSSLLSALVGEMTLVRGRVLLPTTDSSTLADDNEKYRDIIELSSEGLAIRDIAYVAQESWLRNATIRENILFGEPYSQERYEEVLRVCALKPDLRILVAGDMTEIGERGVTLSGGQKQRVALARAVYSSRRILLIDDCLSAVDAHTAKHILMECLLSKTKLMQGRTRVLVTHHVAMCLPYAQYMVMMHEGRITLKGTPAELKNKNTLSLALLESQSENDDSSADSQRNDASNASKGKGKISNIEQDKDNSTTNAVNDTKPEDEYNKEHLIKLAEKRGIDPNSDLSVLQGILIKDEEREEGYVKLEVWKTFMLACGSKVFWGYIISILLVGEAITALRSYWIRLWVASAGSNTSDFSILSSPPFALGAAESPAYASRYLLWLSPLIPRINDLNGDGIMNNSMLSNHHSSMYWLGIYTLLGFVSVAWYVLLWYSVFKGRLAMAREMHRQLIRTVVHAVPRFYDSTPIGRIINRFSRDMAIIDGDALETIVDWFDGIAGVLAIYFIVTVTIPAFAITTILITCILLTIALYYLNTSRELNRLESNSMSPLLSIFDEITQGVTTIRAFGAKHYYIKEAINRIGAYNRPFYTVWAANRWLDIRINTVSAIVSATTAAFILCNLDWIDAGMAGFILSSAMAFSDNMLWVVRDYSENEMNMNAAERIMQYLNIEQEARLESDPENKPPTAWPRKGDVQIENLVVEYVPGVPVLHDISLSAKHSEKIGVVGRTGAGKSTMSLALLRFIEASKGRIVLDGVDISKIGLEDLRRNVTIIPQDPVLFNGTIRFNLDPFGEHPDELLRDALKHTHLVRECGFQADSTAVSVVEDSNSINGNVLTLESMAGIFTSLDVEIRENGQSLSLGQRQLVALARALVRRSKLIIMDEATASVDFDTDDRIQRTIRGPEFANSTLFCIAHRLRTIIDYDRVLVLDKGRIAEFDTPYNLLQNENGIFRSMCEKSGEYEYLLAMAQLKQNVYYVNG